ncbi:acyltransferase [Spirosoma sp. BT702]|uniref:Acyltransferase n=1 Tax=Spirosoma profusum TaxID=2771354 RepID=A0A926Y4G6_9BACT|nr:acyltransferase [Spirosoma profusum]MBD2704538.1 acyltransferase [Spirosoma profusum]
MQIPQLTFTRFLAAAVVLVFHGARGTYPFTVYPGRYLIEYGSVAVVYFFVLSGFILTITYQSKRERSGTINRRQFWMARFARIFPLYFFALLVTLFVLTVLYAQTVTPASILASLTLMQAWIPSLADTLNGPGWSLSVEMFFYVIFPWLLPWLDQFSNRVLLALTVGGWLFGVGLFYVVANHLIPINLSAEAYNNLLNYSPWIHVASFINGCISGLLFWRYVRQHPASANRNRLSWGMLILGAVGLIGIGSDIFIMQYAQGGVLTPVFILFITGLSLQTNTPITKLFSWRPLVYLGEISYGIYILQLPVIKLFKKIDPLGLGDTFLRDIFTFVALFVVTMVCYHLIEKPAQAFIQTRWNTRLVRGKL